MPKRDIQPTRKGYVVQPKAGGATYYLGTYKTLETAQAVLRGFRTGYYAAHPKAIGSKRARQLHITLSKLGLKQSEHYRLASSVAGFEVETLSSITDEMEDEVMERAGIRQAELLEGASI